MQQVDGLSGAVAARNRCRNSFFWLCSVASAQQDDNGSWLSRHAWVCLSLHFAAYRMQLVLWVHQTTRYGTDKQFQQILRAYKVHWVTSLENGKPE